MNPGESKILVLKEKGQLSQPFYLLFIFEYARSDGIGFGKINTSNDQIIKAQKLIRKSADCTIPRCTFNSIFHGDLLQ